MYRIVEFMGMPKAGKTTNIDRLKEFLQHEKGVFARLYEQGARTIPFDKDAFGRFAYNMVSAYRVVDRLLSDYNPDSPGRVVLIDRGIFDHMAFAIALHNAELITEEQRDSSIAQLSNYTDLETHLILFEIAPEEAMKREQTKHPYTGRVMNPCFLGHLFEAYHEVILPIMEEKKKLLVVDGQESLEENKKKIIQFLGL